MILNVARLNKQLNNLLKKNVLKQKCLIRVEQNTTFSSKYFLINANALFNASIFSSFLINYEEICKRNVSHMILIFLNVLTVQFCCVSP